jgi:hypothetical protein
MPVLHDEDAPESFSLQDSKRTVRRQAANLLQFEASEKEKQRARNRQRDKRLKEQAEIPKRRRKDAQARMERAMLDAAKEEREGEGSSEHEAQDVDEDSSDGGSQDEDIEGGEDERMRSDDDSDREDDTKRKTDYLPDHLFVSAFSKPTATSRTISQSSTQAKLPRKGSKRRLRSAKDVVVGSVPCTMSCLRRTKSKVSTCSPRTVRILADPAKTFPSAASTVPRGKVRAFVERSLGLRGKASKSKGWTRKPGSYIH